MTAHRLVLMIAGIAATVAAIVVATCAIIVTATITGPRGIPIQVDSRPTFNQNDLESRVRDALTAQHVDFGGISSLSCPNNVVIIAGTSFTCTLDVGADANPEGAETVLVTVTNDAGNVDAGNVDASLQH